MFHVIIPSWLGSSPITCDSITLLNPNFRTTILEKNLKIADKGCENYFLCNIIYVYFKKCFKITSRNNKHVTSVALKKFVTHKNVTLSVSLCHFKIC